MSDLPTTERPYGMGESFSFFEGGPLDGQAKQVKTARLVLVRLEPPGVFVHHSYEREGATYRYAGVTKEEPVSPAGP